MTLLYKTKKLKKECNLLSEAIKKYGSELGKALLKLINLLENADNLKDISMMPQYRLHKLKGNRIDQYSITILKCSKYRLIIYPLDENNNIMYSRDNENLMFISCIKIQIEEVSEHYE